MPHPQKQMGYASNSPHFHQMVLLSVGTLVHCTQQSQSFWPPAVWQLYYLDTSFIVKDRGFPWVEFMYPYPYPPKPLPLAEGMGFLVVREWVFVKWWGGGEHHCGRCNYQSPGYSLSENIMSRLRLKRNERTLSHRCGVIVGGWTFVKWWGGGEHHCC